MGGSFLTIRRMELLSQDREPASDRAANPVESSPEPASSAGVGARAERSVGTPAGVSASIIQGVDAAGAFDWMNSWQKS
jgi:hypothetical protein